MTPWQIWQSAWKACDSSSLGAAFQLPERTLDILSLGLLATGECDAPTLRQARLFAMEQEPLQLLLLLLFCRLRQGHPRSGLTGLQAFLVPLGEAPESGWSGKDFEALRERFDAELPAMERMLARTVEQLAKDPLAFAPVTGTSRQEPLPLVCVEPGTCPSFSFALHEAAVRNLIGCLQERSSLSGTGISAELCEQLIVRVDPKGDLDRLQADAVRKALSERFVVLTGGPGTGKTTVVACLLWALLESDPTLNSQHLVLCAPTGRAQARLVESVSANVEQLRRAGVSLSPVQSDLAQVRSATLHTLLGARPDGTFRHHKGNPLPYRVVVVDEASMIDLAMFSALLDAVPSHSHLILVGDPDQLPSVDVGAVLADLLAAPGLERHQTKLLRTFRNSGKIALCSAMIRNEKWDPEVVAAMSLDGWKTGQASLPGSVHRLEGQLPDLLDAWVERWLREPGFGCILCAVHGGKAGREAVNRHCDETMRRRIARKGRFFPGQPVILGRNHPERNLWNGDMGRIVEEDGELWARFGTLRVRPGQLEGLDSAWAVTVHKSQGSEFPEVLFLLPERDTAMLTQQIVYTAITRAKRSVLLWGNQEFLALAATRREDRPSRLREI